MAVVLLLVAVKFSLGVVDLERWTGEASDCGDESIGPGDSAPQPLGDLLSAIAIFT